MPSLFNTFDIKLPTDETVLPLAFAYHGVFKAFCSAKLSQWTLTYMITKVEPREREREMHIWPDKCYHGSIICFHRKTFAFLRVTEIIKAQNHFILTQATVDPL